MDNDQTNDATPVVVPDMLLDLQADPDGVQVIAGPERIVRALAAKEARQLQCYGDCGCAFCGVFEEDGGGQQAHDPGCLWRLAREWVAANPASEQGG